MAVQPASPGTGGQILEVVGAPDTIPLSVLKLYFENRRRSGGGEVQAISKEGDRVFVTFDSCEVAERVVQRTQHELKGACLTVRMAENSQGLEPLDHSMEENHYGDGMFGVVVEGVTAHPMNEEVLMVYFENQRRSGGGPVISVLLGCHATALVIFEQEEDASRVLKQPHYFSGMALTVRAAPILDRQVLYLQGVPDTSNLSNELGTTTPLKDQVLALLGVNDKGAVVFTVGCRDGGRNLLIVFTKSLSHQGLNEVTQKCKGSAVRCTPLPRPQHLCVEVPTPELLCSELLSLYFENEAGEEVTVEVDTNLHRAIVTFDLNSEAVYRMLGPLKPIENQELDIWLHYPYLESFASPSACSNTKEPVSTADSNDPMEVDEEEEGQTIPQTGPKLEISNTNTMAAHSSTVAHEEANEDLCSENSLRLNTSNGESDNCPNEVQDQQIEMQIGEENVNAEVEEEAETQVEMVVKMETIEMIYLQEHYCELLQQIAEQVTLLPLTQPHAAGFKVCGVKSRCEAGCELLRGLLCALVVRPLRLQYPGLGRLLALDPGMDLLKRAESVFFCNVSIEQGNRSEETADMVKYVEDSEDLPRFTMERDAMERSSESQVHQLQGVHQHGLQLAKQYLMSDSCKEGNVDEEAQFLLAIQCSMDFKQNEDSLQMALELSKNQDQLVVDLQNSVNLTSNGPSEEEVSQSDLAASPRKMCRRSPSGYHHYLSTANTDDVVLLICAETPEVVTLVMEFLKTGVNDLFHEIVVENDCLNRLNEVQKTRVEMMAQRHSAELTLNGSKATIYGCPLFTTSTVKDLNVLLAGVAQAEQLANEAAKTCSHVTWTRRTTCGTQAYPAAVVAFLEKMRTGKKSKAQAWLGNDKVTFDMDLLQEFDEATGNSSSIERMEFSGEVQNISTPTTEEQMPGSDVGFQLVVQDLADPEIKKIVEEFEEALMVVEKVEKIQNPILYRQFLLKREQVQHECDRWRQQNATSAHPVERMLYHGTKAATCSDICLHGFNRSYAGRNAALYGRGVYFATECVYSGRDVYSPPEKGKGGLKRIFVSRVITGDYAIGHEELCAPPLRPATNDPSHQTSSPLRYHSVVDSVSKPRIFVIFNDTQAYPHMMVTCRWLDGFMPMPPFLTVQSQKQKSP
uniref:protein mono-ADP-ribosyltransferase PARP10-like isoform X2 n=1 Tax=Myxine glutinosa TaxID=7769 RepID=UPI00358EB2B5